MDAARLLDVLEVAEEADKFSYFLSPVTDEIAPDYR